MKTIIVDDEALAVCDLTKILANIEKVDLIATYTSSLLAQNEIITRQPELVFLDIDMPKINGLELGSYLRDALFDVKIIYIASNEHNNLHAIDLDHIDYISKPFDPLLIEKKVTELPHINSEKAQSLPMVCLLGELRFIYFDENQDVEVTQIVDGKWRTKLAREMFIYLMNSRGKYIRKDVLVETFWPDLSPKDGFNILYATIHYMRKFLTDIDFPIIIENADEYYRLHLNGVLVDIDYWLEKTRELYDPLDFKFQQVTKLYKNHYLADESYIWVEYNRQRYRIVWLAFIRQIIQTLEEEQEYTIAILYALNYQHIEPFMEESYFILMKLFAETRDYKSVEQQYERLVEMMNLEYNEQPDEEIINWYESWQNNE